MEEIEKCKLRAGGAKASWNRRRGEMEPRDREGEVEVAMRNRYDADSSSIYLVQRPPP